MGSATMQGFRVTLKPQKHTLLKLTFLASLEHPKGLRRMRLDGTWCRNRALHPNRKREEYIVQVTQIYFHNNIWNEMDTTAKLPTVRCFHTAKFAVVRLCESGRQSAVRYPPLLKRCIPQLITSPQVWVGGTTKFHK